MLCLFGIHRYTHRIDFGLDKAKRTQDGEMGYLFFPDERAICARCGFTKEVSESHRTLTEILPANKGIN